MPRTEQIQKRLVDAATVAKVPLFTSMFYLFSNNPLHFVAKYVLHFSLPWLLPRNHMMSSPSETSSNCSICLIWPFSMAISTFFRFTTIEWSAFKDLRGNLEQNGSRMVLVYCVKLYGETKKSVNERHCYKSIVKYGMEGKVFMCIHSRVCCI